MPRTKKSLLNDLSTADLKRLLVARERIDTLEKEKSKLEKALTAIDKELARLLKDATGAAPRAKAARKKVVRKKTARKKPVRKKGVAAKQAGASKKVTRRKTTRKPATKTIRRKVTRGGGKATLEDVVATVITKNKGPVSFKELYAAIVQGKLFQSKSSNFDNVLRRTLSTSKKVKRVGRGIYDVA